MRIRIVSSDSKSFNILLPTMLVFNGMTASIAGHFFQELVRYRGTELPFTDEALCELIRGIGRWRRTHGPLKLVDVVCADGDRVEVTI